VINKLTGVTCLNTALGREAGKALMPADEMRSQFRQVVANASSTALAVRVMTLREALESLWIDRVDLPKVDIKARSVRACCSPGRTSCGAWAESV
jgi:hypothetical protein